MTRFRTRATIVARALARRLAGPRVRPESPQRILIAHQLLLGDTLMTVALAARLRARCQPATLAMAMPPAFAPLFSGRPYGVEAIAFSPRDPASVQAALATGEPGWDWALLPGDNRFSWLAQAMNARWISGWRDDRPAHKNWWVDEPLPWPAAPDALGDMWADLIEGPACEYSRTDWPAPTCAPFTQPDAPYAVLHIGASNPRKFWPATHWQKLAGELQAAGLTVVLSAGRGEEALTRAVDPAGNFVSFAGRLDLAQLFALVRDAAVLIAPDTGVAHLGKVTGTPTVALFGRGPTAIYARGRFWASMPFRAAVLDELPPRPQTTLFRRPFAWLPEASATTLNQADVRYGSGPAFVLRQAIEIMKKSLT
ncbi:MAG: glycosyltransferase family 9 protein [Betaproteobacteria bacterium]|nr:glycosyltransferase family 9 protein [Betaproteobacteria bacterium]